MKPALAILATALALATGACASASPPDTGTSPQQAFFANVSALCGKAYVGRILADRPAPTGADPFAGKPLVMHVASCEPGRVRVPFHVGEDRSRTWVFTRTAAGVRLKHDHRHEDGTSDKLTMYGGDTVAPGTAIRQVFPVDAESIALFRAQGSERSVTNVWAVEADTAVFAYELRRPGRHFRVEFDLTRPIAAPPLPWGWRN